MILLYIELASRAKSLGRVQNYMQYRNSSRLCSPLRTVGTAAAPGPTRPEADLAATPASGYDALDSAETFLSKPPTTQNFATPP